MTVSVLVPFRAQPGSDRDRIWAWMRQRWETLLPDWELVIRPDWSDDPDRFNEGQALNGAARGASGDVLVITEAEIAFNPDDLRGAVEYVEGGGGWCLPSVYHQLTQDHSQHLLNDPPEIHIGQPAVTERSWWGDSSAPIIVVPRDAYRLVGGWEDRYPGWGWADKAFVWALTTLWKPPQRFPGSSFHFWHERTEAVDSNPVLSERYAAACGDQAAMQTLIDERAA